MAVKTEPLGDRIRTLRLERGLSQEVLAEPNYTAAYISQIENGKRNPSREVLEHIADRLGIDVDYLISGRDPNEDILLEIEIQKAIAELRGGAVKGSTKTLFALRDRAKELDHTRALVDAELGVALALYRSGRIPDALGAYSRALEYSPANHASWVTSAIAGQARCLFQMGDTLEAIHLLESHLLELQARDEADPSAFVEVYSALIPVYFESGMIERAKRAATEGWKIAPTIPDPEPRACLYVNRAQLMLLQGEPREALVSLALAADIYSHLGWYAEATKVSLARALAMTEEGDLDGAQTILVEALEGSAVGQADRVRALTQLALISRLKGDLERASNVAQEAIDAAGESVVGAGAEAKREAGICAHALGDSGKAERLWTEALDVFCETGDHEEAAKTARLLGDHFASTGRHEEAVNVYRRGLSSVQALR
ncbi:MAG: tetratricopeptide repeat protein [Actinomycetota bacterium]|nr:tetratricopeptide repeat protein [Actinomycetota bacterium]